MTVIAAEIVDELFLDFMISKPLTLRLFKNNVNITRKTTIEAFQEADFAGYEPKDLSSWKKNSLVASHPDVQWESTSYQTPQNIYGYYMEADDSVYFAEVFFDGPYTIQNESDKIKVSPKLRVSGR